MTQNRKRSRSLHDETEFMPLSKRINNLHINNMNSDWAQNAPSIIPESPESDQSVDWNLHNQYSPDLTESQNPHYFNINKLLYEMYVERMSREGHQI